MSTTPMATTVSPVESSISHDLRMAWLWCGVAALLLWGPMVMFSAFARQFGWGG